MKKTQRKDQCGIGKTLNIPHKKQKATKIEKSYISIECLEVPLKGNRDEK